MSVSPNTDTSKIGFQRNIAIIGVVLFLAKLFAWYVTKSDAIFSDAMESIVNIISAFLGLYALYLANKPRDNEHPYGHGKIEFVTSAIEGTLIILAGILILVKATESLLQKNELRLEWGILLFAATGIINYVLGYLSLQKGKKENSLVLISSGKHLQSDTYTTLGAVLSLVLVYFTKQMWIDAVVSLIFGVYIMFVGYKIVRKSLGGIMDEKDEDLIARIAEILNENRKKEWIDVHNTKVQQFGSHLHIDAHITLPWYENLKDAHKEMENVIYLLLENASRTIEFNFHMDYCKPVNCPICCIEDCPVRKVPFVKKIEWNAQNISKVERHTI